MKLFATERQIFDCTECITVHRPGNKANRIFVVSYTSFRRFKAEFFNRFGFEVQNWQELADSLKEHCCTHEICEQIAWEYGTMYSVEGKLRTPDRRNPPIRSVWQIDTGKNAPRFITAYPLERQHP